MFVKTTCGFCFAGCGLIFRLEGGRPIEVEGDPESPVNRGVVCEKAKAALEYLNNPYRLKRPLKRVKGGFVETSWDEALKLVAEKLLEVREKHGSESVAFIHGAAKGYQDTFLRRFANCFGSPNLASMGHVCFLPRKFGSEATFGYYPSMDPVEKPGCVVVWASNKPGIAEHKKTLDLKRQGVKLIVVDPVKTEAASSADIWLRIRPGADLALALSMINVVLEENLYDREFVERWTVGFHRLLDEVSRYTPEWAEEVTWVDADDIRRAARLYAGSRPSYIRMGNALEHNLDAFQTVRAISILKAVTGNLSIPGGEVFKKAVPVRGRYAPELTLDDILPGEKAKKRLGAMDFSEFYRFAHPPMIVRAMLEGEPYPVKAAYIQGANPLITYPNARKVRQALESLEFLVVSDIFFTPTAALADVVLPAASFMEYDSVVNPPYYPVAQVQEGFYSYHQARSDYSVLNELAHRMGFGEHFFEDEREFLDLILEPSGMDFEEFKEVRYLSGEPVYKHYEEAGFSTPSGKVEIFSERLERMGIEPVPRFKGVPSGKGFVFTSFKSPYYRHSGMRQVDSLRKLHPEPVVLIARSAAERLGIRDGDLVRIKGEKGSIVQRALLVDYLDPRCVVLDYAWWFPERGLKENFGWDEANINVLIDDSPPYGKELGTVNLRGLYVELEPVKSR